MKRGIAYRAVPVLLARMTTVSLVGPKRGLLIAALVALLGLGNLAAVPPMLTVALTGGDAGQGLTLDAANVVTAWNINSEGSPVTLQGVVFTDNTLGSTFTGDPAFEFTGLEASADDFTLGAMLSQGSWDGINETPLAFTFTGLTPNASYRFDLLQSLIQFGPREQAIVVNGSLVTLVSLDSYVAYNTSFLVTAKENGEIDLLVIESGGYGGEGIQDGAVLNALVLTSVAAIPEPATYAALLGLGALGLAVWRRQKRNLKLET